MNRLKDLREDKDLTQKEIAVMLGIGQAGYSKYENEKNNIPTDILNKLPDFYNMSTDYILLELISKMHTKKVKIMVK